MWDKRHQPALVPLSRSPSTRSLLATTNLLFVRYGRRDLGKGVRRVRASRHLLRVEDLEDDEVTGLLGRARELRSGEDSAVTVTDRARMVGLLFLTSSLRTRVGFAVAAAHLGLAAVDVVEPRWSLGMSAPESLEDTFLTAGSLVDVLVVRTPERLEAELVDRSCSPVVNAGDGGALGSHPTQALIDLDAIQSAAGPIAGLDIAICGDLGQRAVRSLLDLLERFPPSRLVLVAPPGRRDDVARRSESWVFPVEWREPDDLRGVDVLYMAGLPAGEGEDHLSAEVRGRYSFGGAVAASLPAEALVFSPMPVVDEIAPESRRDPRLRLFETVERSVAVRTAVLEWALGVGPVGGRT